jgi:FAD/FMN-containing dehydrogenase/Fe-S oxidoreductase
VIPRLTQQDSVDALYREFVRELVTERFAGEIRTDYAARLIAATDNSVYQLLPQAVLYPRSRDDVAVIGRLAGQPRFRSIRLTPRGGGTGTTGASLGTGIAVDLSKYMNHILDFDAAAGVVRVEPGVVLDQLNTFLAPHGVFFAPHVAPSDRATLGGMISTDACGKGSRIYGRTSRHIASLDLVLSDGSQWRTTALPVDDPGGAGDDALPPRIATARRVTAHAVREHADLIRERFPSHSRFLSGYDLVHAWRPDGRIDLAAIVAGSEGTLAFVVEAALRVTPIPPLTQLIAIAYPSFAAALAAAAALLAWEPSAVETIDETILELARTDVAWPRLAARFAASAIGSARALHLVELSDSDAGRLESRIAAMLATAAATGATAAHRIDDGDEARAFWMLRDRGVGLIAGMEGARRPVPFVEDCAVPPQHLAEFTAAFRDILTSHGLRYAMYGHVDVGCLHVRPALDLRDPGDGRVLRAVSDRVFRLVQAYGGVFWGEHGKGMRSEYGPEVFGPVLYQQVRHIKDAFDPFDQMNPGKVATPSSSDDRLVSVDSPMRGERDREIAPRARAVYEGAVACNGNGACFTWDADRPMCPSMKVTADRVHSPKGRAALMREWLRQLSTRGWDADGVLEPVPTAAWLDPRRWWRRATSPSDFSHEVFAAFAGCLSCKACVAHCPVHVDIPSFKADFLHAYHQRYPRALADHLVAKLETALPRASEHAHFFNRLLRWTRPLHERIGLADLPALAPVSAERQLRQLGADFVAWGEALSEGSRRVVLVPDAFTNFFAPEVFVALHELARGTGAAVFVLPYRASGKSLHVKGFLYESRAIATRNARDLARLAGGGVDLVCVEPAVALFFRQEYGSLTAAGTGGFRVLLPQEWLVANLGPPQQNTGEPPYQLLSHCTEATTAAAANELWIRVFAALGLVLEIPPVGCCGMAGAYGHERQHRTASRGIFDQSWRRRIDGGDPSRVLATGHSCRTQVTRLAGFTPRHPLAILAR